MAPKFKHLDNAQSIFFARELEHIAARESLVKRPPLRARRLIPTLAGIPDWALVHTWRMIDGRGKAQVIAPGQSSDLPRSDVSKSEGHRTIFSLGTSFGYTIDEIKYSEKVGAPLDRSRADEAATSINTLIDKLIAFGDSAFGIEGVLTLTGAGTFTPATKTGTTGDKTWGKIGDAVTASGLEMAADVHGLVGQAYSASNETFEKFRVVLPPDQYDLAAITLINTGNSSNMTALDFMRKSEHVLDIHKWQRTKNAGSVAGTGGNNTRMLAFPVDDEVVGAVIPEEYHEFAAQLKGFEYIVPAKAKCGGVISRYPSMVRFGDGI